MRGALVHVIGDMLCRDAALIAGLVILASDWMPIDALLSALVAFLMIRSGWGIARESAYILLEGAPEGLNSEQVEAALRAAVPQLEGIHHLHSWSLADEQCMVVLVHLRTTVCARPPKRLRALSSATGNGLK